MASKGQKLRTYAPETKGQILKEYLEENVSSSYLAKKYGVPRCTIKNWVRKAKHGILKKETLYNNNIASLEHYIQLVEEWIAFYNSARLKNRNLN